MPLTSLLLKLPPLSEGHQSWQSLGLGKCLAPFSLATDDGSQEMRNSTLQVYSECYNNEEGAVSVTYVSCFIFFVYFSKLLEGSLLVCRNKRLRGAQSASAVIAALRYEDEESDDGNPSDSNDGEEPDNPRWQLYNAVRNTTNNQGGPNQKLTFT